MFERSDESDWDLKRKKLFLFPPERMELSLNRLSHYTGTEAEDFQRYVLFTNYNMHVEAFCELFPDCVRPESRRTSRCRRTTTGSTATPA